jgi:hypothetical protein
MKLIIMAALALNFFAATPSFDALRFQRALANYRAMLAGQRELGELSTPDRVDVLELERWLGSRGGIVPSETKEQCKERLGSKSPTQLEEALLDLKCSQRPNIVTFREQLNRSHP